MEKSKEESVSINEALGISHEWKVLTDDRIENLIDTKDTISELIESEALTIKAQEFGEGNYELTPYEKKLMLSGFMISKEIQSRQIRAAATEAMMGLLAAKLGIDPSAEA